MKVLVLRTYTGCEPLYKSLEAAGHDLIVHHYDDRPHNEQQYFVDLVKKTDCDFVVYIGAPEPYHGKPTLRPNILYRIRLLRPLIHICGDAADDPWWPILEGYDKYMPKCIALHTYTDCENKMRSLECLGFEVHRIQYDNYPHDQQDAVIEQVKQINPDFMVFIGALEPYHTRPVLTTDTLCRLREIAPLIHMCNDAADDPWWPKLEEYNQRSCFTVQVSIDGSYNNPIASFANGMLMLTPTDYRPFEQHYRIWDERDFNCSIVGGLGHSFRANTINHLLSMGKLNFFEGPIGRSYDEMAAILCNSKSMPSFAHTGTAKYLHTKGRVIEAGLAGCCLFEQRGSPTVNWFVPGHDYFEYESADDIIRLLDLPDSVLKETAERFSKRVWKEHHPKVFWNKVLEKAGILFWNKIFEEAGIYDSDKRGENVTTSK